MIRKYIKLFKVLINNIKIIQFTDSGTYAIRKGYLFYKYQELYKSTSGSHVTWRTHEWLRNNDKLDGSKRRGFPIAQYTGDLQLVGSVYDHFYSVENTRVVYIDRDLK